MVPEALERPGRDVGDGLNPGVGLAGEGRAFQTHHSQPAGISPDLLHERPHRRWG